MRLGPMIAVGLIGAVLGAGAYAATTRGGGSSKQASVSSPVSTASVANVKPATATQISLAATLTDYSSLYAAVRPSVVEIDTSGVSGRRRPQQVQGQGSGVVIDAKGDILTNEHVITGAQSIQITFADGTQASATLVGNDTANDLAIVKTDAGQGELHPATFGDSGALVVGNAVIAVGNPFGLAGSLSAGVVSGLDRTLQGGGGQPDETGLLQTDAAINEGSSGGGLFNASGQLVGITSALENPDASTFAGVGYAVPINIAKQLISRLIGG